MVQKVKIKIKAILEQLENILRVGNLNKYDWWKDRVCSSWGRAGYENNLNKICTKGFQRANRAHMLNCVTVTTVFMRLFTTTPGSTKFSQGMQWNSEGILKIKLMLINTYVEKYELIKQRSH